MVNLMLTGEEKINEMIIVTLEEGIRINRQLSDVEQNEIRKGFFEDLILVLAARLAKEKENVKNCL